MNQIKSWQDRVLEDPTNLILTTGVIQKHMQAEIDDLRQAIEQAEHEVRDDGERVRVDRWQVGIRRIVALLWGNRHEFEVDEVVEAVRKLIPAPLTDDEGLCRSVLSDAPTAPAQPIIGLQHVHDAILDDPSLCDDNPPAQPLTCTWTLDDEESGTWASSCGELWSFIDGGPDENRVSYCHHCGGKVNKGASL